MASLDYGFYLIHPGEMSKNGFEVRGVSQREFADSIGMDYSVPNKILNDRRSPNTTTTLVFETTLDIPAESLTKLQLGYNTQTARTDKTLADKLEGIA